MPRLAQMTYPTATLTESVRVTERVARDFSGQISTSGLAKALDMAEKGGGFLHKVAAIKGYGLVEGRGTLQITPLAERIIYPHSETEGAAARGEAFLGVELFQRLFDRTQGRVPDEESFAIFLQDITGANRVDIARTSSRIRRIFADGLEFAKAAAQRNAQPLEEAEEEGRLERPTRRPSGGDTIELLAGDVELRLPRTAQSVDVIISVLEMMKRELSEESVHAGKAPE